MEVWQLVLGGALGALAVGGIALTVVLRRAVAWAREGGPPAGVTASFSGAQVLDVGQAAVLCLRVANAGPQAEKLSGVSFPRGFLELAEVASSTPPWTGTRQLRVTGYTTLHFGMDLAPGTQSMLEFHIVGRAPGTFAGDVGVVFEPVNRSVETPVSMAVVEPGAVEGFWRWFGTHAAGFRPDPATWGELPARLKAIHPGLAFEMGPGEFIVSGDGIREHFPLVRKVVAEAPPVPGWRIIAFRQPKEAEEVRFGPVTLRLDDVWFRTSEAGDLDLYVRGWNGSHDQLGATFVLLDNALGEEAVATRVGAIRHHALPEDPASRGLKPLRELRV